MSSHMLVATNLFQKRVAGQSKMAGSMSLSFYFSLKYGHRQMKKMMLTVPIPQLS